MVWMLLKSWYAGKKFGQKTLDFRPEGVCGIVLLRRCNPAKNNIMRIHLMKRDINPIGDFLFPCLFNLAHHERVWVN